MLKSHALLAVFALPLPHLAAAADRTTAGALITEPPTLVSLGFEWEMEGDDNRNAQVAVSYRKKGTEAWRTGLPLLRLQGERINRGPLQYTAPNLFAGSVFDLEPDTEYERTGPGFHGSARRVLHGLRQFRQLEHVPRASACR